jgi:glycosyltransferase involved in cell wall biosynthesis
MKNKILIIGPFPKPISGVSIANQTMANGLRKKNWKVDIINSEYSKEIGSKLGKISFHKFYFIKAYFLVGKVFFSNIIYITIGQSFFGVLKYFPFVILAKFCRKKTVVHLHGNHLLNEYNLLKGIKKSIFFKLISMFDYGIVLSKSLRKNLEPFLKKETIFELHNFFEESLNLPSKQLIEQKDYSELRVVFLSNLIEEKGINILLEALNKLNQKGIKIQLKIAGNKIKENDLSHFCDNLEYVAYLGVVSGLEKQKLLLWSNVFCLPTFYKMEGQPISILEAMAMGNLILTTNHAGIMDVCKEENAFFCKKESVEDLANKLELLFGNINLIQQKGLFNVKYANTFFTEKIFIENANKILLECIN